MKSSYKYMSETWRESDLKQKMIGWRKEAVMTKTEKPTRLDRARALGYKAKQGYVLVRTRIRKGSRHRPKPAKGRNPIHFGRVRYTAKKSMQALAEMRIARRFPNLEVLNSYYIGDDGVQKFYEIILVDPNHPVIKSDPKINWICSQRRRVYHGLTSAAKKARAK